MFRFLGRLGEVIDDAVAIIIETVTSLGSGIARQGATVRIFTIH